MNKEFNIINWNSKDLVFAEQIGLLPGKNTAVMHNNDTYLYTPYGREVPAHSVTIPFDWNNNIFDDRNWFAQLHMMRMLDANIVEYERTGDFRYMNFPCSIFSDWLAFYKSNKTKQTPALVWSDMIVGIRALRLSYCISYLISHKKNLDKGFDKSIYEELVDQHLSFLLNIKNYKFNNHSIHDLHGLMGLAQVVNVEWEKKIIAFVKKNMPLVILSQFNSQGMHLENSPEYHNYGMMLFDKLYKTGWFSEFDLESFLIKAEKFKNWFVLPDGRLLPFGDTTRKKAPKRKEAFEFISDTNVLNNSGYAIIRSVHKDQVKDSSYLAFMGACNSKTHKHSDDLSVFWFEGQEILSDMGKYAYQNCSYRKHALSTRAHNTIEMNEEDYYHGTAISEEQIFGSAIERVEIVDFGYHIKASVRRKRLSQTKGLDIDHQRNVLYCLGRYLIIVDRILSSKNLKFINWLNFSPNVVLINDISFDETKYKYELKLSTTNRKLYVEGRVNPNKYRVFHGKGLDEPRTIGWNSDKYNNAIPSLAVGVEAVGKDISYITIFSLDESVIKADLDLEEGKVSIYDALTNNNYIVKI